MFVAYFPSSFFFFNDTATTEIYTLSLHDALPISKGSLYSNVTLGVALSLVFAVVGAARSEEHTSELQSLAYLVCRLLLEKKKTQKIDPASRTNYQGKIQDLNTL